MSGQLDAVRWDSGPRWPHDFIHKMDLLSMCPHLNLSGFVAILFVVLMIKPRALQVLGECSVTELFPEPLQDLFQL